MQAGSLVIALLAAQPQPQAHALPTLPPAGDVAAAAGQVEAAHQDGQRLSHEVANLTGAQLSPLFMMGVLGGVRWLRAAPGARASLPWHQQPWFWGTAFALTLLLWFGDKVPVVRHAVKPVKLFENKLSGLLAAVVLVGSFASAAAAPLACASTSALGALLPSALAADGATPAVAALGSGALLALAWAVGLAISGAVWLAGHTVNVIALVHPFAPLDALLRTARLAVIGLVLGAAWLGPAPGLAVSALTILAAFAVAGWSMRLTVFGAVFSFDLLAGRDDLPEPARLTAFAGAGLPGVPPRTLGRLAHGPAGRCFRYRPWLILPARSAPLPAAGAVGRGLLSPVLLTADGPGRLVLLRFPPRFRRRSGELAAALGGLPVVDASVLGGLRAAWAWLTGGAPSEGA